MIILAIESSAKTASAAVWKDGGIAAELSVNNTLTHSQTLMPMIEQVLEMSGVQIENADAFACNAGPGSFTGVRIGVSTVKALAHGTNKPCIAVNTLDALANNIACRGLVVPLMDARCGQVYTAVYNRGDKLELLGGYEAIKLEGFLEGLAMLQTDVVFTGDGTAAFEELIKQKLGGRAVIAPAHLLYARAASTAQLAAEKFDKGELLSYEQIAPFYLRAPQAERAKNAEKN